MTAPVTIVSCLYGDGYERFVEGWTRAVHALENQPERIIVATDRHLTLDRVLTLERECSWRYPQAFYLQQAIDAAETEWVLLADIDDLLMPAALNGIEDVDADVWQLGFERSDGATHIVPDLTNEEYLASWSNHYVQTSAIRVEAFREAGGFRDVAFQDWELWRRMARLGMRFQSSGRTHFRYMRHPATRGATELTPEFRPAHLAEMMEAELASV